MEEFVGFTFAGIHSSKFKVYAVSSNGTYTQPLFANFTDKIVNVDGLDETYYFGTNYTSKVRTINCIIDGADENMLRNIKRWLNPKRIGKLTFDEAPYKYYMVKVSATPELYYYPIDDGYGGHLYYGTFSLQVTAYNPFAYSYFNSIDDWSYIEESEADLYYDSGILYADETPPSIVENITSNTGIFLYNGGSVRTKPIITISGSADFLTLTNITTGQSFTLNSFTDETIVIDCQKGQVTVNGLLASSYHNGGYIELEGTDNVENYGDIKFINGNNQVAINDLIDLNIVGKFIAIDNTWYEIVDCNYGTGKIALDRLFEGESGYYSFSMFNLNKLLLSGVNLNISSVEFNYKYRYL